MHRVVNVAAEFKRGSRRSRRQNEITLTKGRLKIIGYKAAQFLRFQVVRIVVTMTQYISTDHDTALNLTAETFGTGVAVHFFKVAELRRTVAVTYAVETGQVGTCFCRGENVISGNRQ